MKYTCRLRSRRSKSFASGVRYGGRLSLHRRIFSIVFLRFSAVNGGAPVSISYIKAPSDHQSTACVIGRWDKCNAIDWNYYYAKRDKNAKKAFFVKNQKKLFIHALKRWEIGNGQICASVKLFFHSSLQHASNTTPLNDDLFVKDSYLGMAGSHKNFWRHVFDCAAEGIRHVTLLNRLFTQTEIG